MKKLLLCVFLVLCVLSLTWAGGKQEVKQQKLSFWTLQQAAIDIQTAHENAVKDFEKEFNCDVEVTSFPYVELRDKMLTAVAAGRDPISSCLINLGVAVRGIEVRDPRHRQDEGLDH
jgi:ABC-type glycerol-3-phosphate transport system substrate-binding protein